MKRLLFILYCFVTFSFFVSCEEDEPTEYVISGKITCVDYNLSGYKVSFECFTSNPLLSDESYGSTKVDSGGNFVFSYKTKYAPTNDLRMVLRTSSGNVEETVTELPHATNWYKEFNFSKKAFIEVTFNTIYPLETGDTLYVSGPNGLQIYLPPFENGTKFLFEVSNTSTGFFWAREYKKLNVTGPNSLSVYPTGAPTVDKVTINY